MPGGGGTHYMKVTTYAPPFRPPFFRSLENLYSFEPYILAKMRKMSYFDPYFSSKLGKMYSFDPPFLTLVAFRVDGRCWASLSETRPSTPPGDRWSRFFFKRCPSNTYWGVFDAIPKTYYAVSSVWHAQYYVIRTTNYLIHMTSSATLYGQSV